MVVTTTSAAKTITQALKLLEPYSRGAKAWFKDGDDAWVKATLTNRTVDELAGIARVIFVHDGVGDSPTTDLVAQTSALSARQRRVSQTIPSKVPSGEDLKKLVSRNSRLTGGRLSSIQTVEGGNGAGTSYIVDVLFSELVELGADSDLLPPLCNPPILDCTPDLTTLSYLHEPAVLYNLMRRYENHDIYTYSGVVLVAVNPFHPVPLYSAETMQQYAKIIDSSQDKSPHLFAIAEDAYQGMVRHKQNQTIIVYGESGSGKTTSAKYIMRYFAQAHHSDTNNKQMSTVEHQLLATNPVFESFGNAKTTRNDNSSRFGKFFDIKFERKRQQIVGGRIRTFLLERSRVAYQPPTERNYHIFYQLLAGADDSLRRDLHLSGEYDNWRAFHYTCQGGDESGRIAGVDDADEFALTESSLELVGIDSEQRYRIWRTLAGILHLGNVGFAGSDTIGSYINNQSEELFSIAAELLGVDDVKLRQWLTKRQIVTRHDHILAKVNKAQALVIRDSIAKFIYSRLFDWILGPINASLLPASVDESDTTFVGVLDIYGFEHFETNSFEQFCINYANEKLQQGFNHHVFKLVQDEYKRERLTNWTFIGFQDNQPCIDLIEGKPIGILSLLDEESRLEQGSDRTFTEKLYRQFESPNGPGSSSNKKPHQQQQQQQQGISFASGKDSPTGLSGLVSSGSSSDISAFFRKPRFSNTAFTVKHYAHDVTYEGEGFLEKNKDTVPDEILDLLCASKFPFVAELAQRQIKEVAASSSPRTASPAIPSTPTFPPPSSSSKLAPLANGIAGSRVSPRVASSGTIGGSGALQRRQAPTLAGVFRRSLAGLMATLSETEMHYIRCIKPNEAKAAWKFQPHMVLSQLRSCGVIETIRISKAGYPSRVPIRRFNERYTILLEKPVPLITKSTKSTKSTSSSTAAPGGNTSAGEVEKWERDLCQRILGECNLEEDQYQIGITKVFFRAGQWAIMEKKRSLLFEKSALVIQRFARGCLVRKSYKEMTTAAVKIQRRFRTHRFACRIEDFRLRHAVRVIERRWAQYCEVRRCKMQEECALCIQRLARGYLARVAVRRLSECAEAEKLAWDCEEAEAARREAESERLRVESAKQEAEAKKTREAAQAAREQARENADAARKAMLNTSPPKRQQQVASSEADIDLQISDVEREIQRVRAETQAMLTSPQPSSADLIANGPSSAIAMPDLFADIQTSLSQSYDGVPCTSMHGRRPSTQSTDHARLRAAEARASLLAAGIAERDAEASLSSLSPRQSPDSPTSSSQSEFQVISEPRSTPDLTLNDSNRDSLTIGSDLFAIIDEFSDVSGGRYGEVSTRRHLNAEMQNPFPATYQDQSENTQPQPNTQQQQLVKRKMYSRKYQDQQTNIPKPSHSWLHAASSTAVIKDAGKPGDQRVYQQPHIVYGKYEPNPQASYIYPPRPAQVSRPETPLSTTISSDMRVMANHGSIRQTAHKQQSHSNISVLSGQTQATASTSEFGGRHTAARARAWALRQKERVINALTDGKGRRSSNSRNSTNSPLAFSSTSSNNNNNMYKVASGSSVSVASSSALPPPPRMHEFPNSADGHVGIGHNTPLVTQSSDNLRSSFGRYHNHSFS